MLMETARATLSGLLISLSLSGPGSLHIQGLDHLQIVGTFPIPIPIEVALVRSFFLFLDTQSNTTPAFAYLSILGR